MVVLCTRFRIINHDSQWWFWIYSLPLSVSSSHSLLPCHRFLLRLCDDRFRSICICLVLLLLLLMVIVVVVVVVCYWLVGELVCLFHCWFTLFSLVF